MRIFNQNRNRNDIYLLNDMCKIDEYSACMRCENPRCKKINNDSIKIEKIKYFSYDKDFDVCPVDALQKNDNGDLSIDNKKCILCGLCSYFCPISAIKLSNFKMTINNERNNNEYLSVPNSYKNIQKQEKQLSKLYKIKSLSNIIENESMFNIIYNRIKMMPSTEHNKLARNLLIGVGAKCVYPRKGDVANRMDGIFEIKDNIGVIEVEFGADSLSTSRGLLDDVAMLHYKQNIPVNKINALSVMLELPNERQDYWNVIHDVYKITGLKINTITIGALLILLWNGKKICLNNNKYFLSSINKSLRKGIEDEIGRKLYIEQGYLGIFEPEK